MPPAPTPLGRHGMVAEALTHAYKDRFGVLWNLAGPDWTASAESVSQIAHAADGAALPGAIQILSKRSHKRVFRMAPAESAHGSVVAKVFRLSSLYRRLRHQIVGYNRFALGEAVNLITAARRGLNVPQVYGYGCVYGKSRLISMDLLLIEDLATCVPVGRLLEQHAADRDRCAELLDRVAPVFEGLFRAGCNHIDVNPGAILLDGHDWTKTFLLDFEHAMFRCTPSLEVLAFEAAYFARCCRRWMSKDIIDRWFAGLVKTIGTTDAIQEKAVTDRFNHYLNTDLSRSQRRRIQ